jgi:Holliday junction resolvase RusA-like endonuclease
MTDTLVLDPPRTSTPPDLTITVLGAPAPQGSKKHVGNGVMLEMSKKLKPWRDDVKAAARAVMASGHIGDVELHRPPLDGPLAVSIVFTVREQPASRPTWWPSGERWSKTLQWRPASTPDLSKLLRSTEDALTGVAWKDDARVVEYTRLAKYYVGHPAEDVLPHTTGAVIRIWRLS